MVFQQTVLQRMPNSQFRQTFYSDPETRLTRRIIQLCFLLPICYTASLSLMGQTSRNYPQTRFCPTEP